MLGGEQSKRANGMGRREDYLRKVRRQADYAVIQAGAVTQCDRHRGVLLFLGTNAEIETNAYNLASIWLAQEGTIFMREDLEDGIKSAIDGAARDGCPECAREKEF
jgi:hypothetical protein